MAKKRPQKEEDEEIDFKIPKFDEKAFITKEKRNAKIMLISFLLGSVLGLISFGFWVLLTESSSWIIWPLVFLFGVINMSWLRYLFIKLDIDVSGFGKKEWFTSYAMYFFSWLLVLLLLVNPPFYDAEEPVIDLAVLPMVQEPGGTVYIIAQIVDNVAVHKEGVEFSLTDPLGETITPSFTYEDYMFEYTFTNPDNLLGEFTFSLVATDVNGKVNTKFSNVTFEYATNALEVYSRYFTDLTSRDDFKIIARKDIATHNFLVYYTIDEGEPVYANRNKADDSTEYITSPSYIGWREQTNHTLQAYAEVMYYFLGNELQYSNIVMDSTIYNISTTVDANIGVDESPVPFNCTARALGLSQPENVINYPLPCPIVIQTPGFEVAVMFAALFIGAIYIKRRRSSRHQT